MKVMSFFQIVFDWFSEILSLEVFDNQSNMPVIKVWCLPIKGEEKLNKLHKAIVSAVVGVSELKLTDENDMTVLFPPDLMKYGLGSVIIIEITGLFQKKGRTREVLQKLCAEVGKSVKNLYPDAKVECSVQTLNPQEGFWESAIVSKNKEVGTKLVNLSNRLLKCLNKAGINTEEQLLATSTVDILKLPSLGTYSFYGLREWANEKGYVLKDMDMISKLLEKGYTILYIKSNLI